MSTESLVKRSTAKKYLSDFSVTPMTRKVCLALAISSDISAKISGLNVSLFILAVLEN